jgi:hypothetical protein
LLNKTKDSKHIKFKENHSKIITKLISNYNKIKSELIYLKVIRELEMNYKDIRFKLIHIKNSKFEEFFRGFPRDILNIIISYNNNFVNEEKHSKVINEIKYKNKNIEFIVNNAELGYHIHTRKFSYKKCERFIENCKKCYCCDDHCHKKPLSVEYNYYNTQCLIFDPTKNLHYKDCNCKCRHFSRIYFDIYHTMSDIDTWFNKKDYTMVMTQIKTNTRVIRILNKILEKV